MIRHYREFSHRPGGTQRQQRGAAYDLRSLAQQAGTQLFHARASDGGDAGHGRFRLTLAEEEKDRSYYVHIDSDAHWAGILYLTPDGFCQGGTEFYRHRGHAIDRTYITDAEAREHGWPSCSQFAVQTIQNDGDDVSKWEQLMMAPMRFNRWIQFRAWFWHTAGASFGGSFENGRLVQLFFWRPAKR